MGSAGNQADLLRLLRVVQPWLVAVDVNLAPQDVAQLAAVIEEDCLAAVLYIGRQSPVSGRYPSIPWPAGLASLPAVAEAVCLEFAQKKKLHQEVLHLRQKLAARREVDRAKGLLMNRSNLSEEEAYRCLRRRSMAERRSLEEVARGILREE